MSMAAGGKAYFRPTIPTATPSTSRRIQWRKPERLLLWDFCNLRHKSNQHPAELQVPPTTTSVITSARATFGVPVRRALMGHGWAPLVDGWQVSGTVFVRSGLPYSRGRWRSRRSSFGSGFWRREFLPQFLGGPISSCGEGAATGATPCLTTAQFVPSTSETNFIEWTAQ